LNTKLGGPAEPNARDAGDVNPTPARCKPKVEIHDVEAPIPQDVGVMTAKPRRSRLSLLLVSVTTLAILGAGAFAVLNWSHARPQAVAASGPAQADAPVKLAQAQKEPPPQPQKPQPPAPRPAQIDRNGMLILVRSTLVALDQANKTGNYTVLRDLGSPEFQVNSAARLGEIFAKQRHDGVDLSGVAVIEPQLTLAPQIEANGMMRMAGFFPSVPTQTNFELMYAPVNRQWRLFAIGVSFGQAAPAAPEPPAPPAPPPEAAHETGHDTEHAKSGAPKEGADAHPTPSTETPSSGTKQ